MSFGDNLRCISAGSCGFILMTSFGRLERDPRTYHSVSVYDPDPGFLNLDHTHMAAVSNLSVAFARWQLRCRQRLCSPSTDE